MGVLSVEAGMQEFEKRFNNRDAAGLLALYEPNASFVAEPGKVATGHDAISSVLDAFLSLNGELHFHKTTVVNAGNVTLASARWSLDGTTPDGQPVHLEGTSAEVWRQQPDGSWLFVIDNPYGGAIPE